MSTKITRYIAALLSIVCLSLAGCGKSAPDVTPNATSDITPTTPQVAPLDDAELFRAAVLDVMVIEQDELFPLIEITPESNMCSFDEQGRVLMLTYHSYPDSYIAGEEYQLVYGAVWTFTEREIIAWYSENKDEVVDWSLRFKQLIGLPPDREYTHFSGFWAHPDDIIRPGYAWRLTDTVGASTFIDAPDDEYKSWFDGNIIWSYFDSAYPWTRLGYTYDWAADSGKYGLSEFLVAKDAVTTVEFTLTTEAFVEWLEEEA